MKKIAVIILAAGLGTRMKSNKAKVLHEILGKPMVMYVVETAMAVAGNDVIVVVGHQAERVRQFVSQRAELIYAVQPQQLGTGHAVLCALPFIPAHTQQVVILCGDVPLITPRTVVRLIEDHERRGRDVSVLAVELEDPTGYGRLLSDADNQVRAIVEESDATAEQKRIKRVNSGIFCINKNVLLEILPKIKPDNAQDEIYLTDIIEIGYNNHKNIGMMVSADSQEVKGVNSIRDLNDVVVAMRRRQRIKS